MTYEQFCKKYKSVIEKHSLPLEVSEEEISKMYIALYVLEEHKVRQERISKKHSAEYRKNKERFRKSHE